MFFEKASRRLNLKLYVASADGSAERFIEAVAKKSGVQEKGLFARFAKTLRGLWSRSDKDGPFIMFPLSIGTHDGWETELHLYATVHPSPPYARLLCLKGSDAILLVSAGASQQADQQVLADLDEGLAELGYESSQFPRDTFVTSDADLETGNGVMEALERMTKKTLELALPALREERAS